MVNELILKKFDQQIDLIDSIFNKYFRQYFGKCVNSVQNLIELNQLNKPIQDVSQIKLIESIKTRHESIINSVCLLKDKRLVSASGDSFDISITVYNRAYQPHFFIKNAHLDHGISSLCALRNGQLLSASDNGEIKVWEINEDNYELVQTLKEHTDTVCKVIELKDGKICSCSNDKTLKIWDDNYKCLQTLKNHTALLSILEISNLITSVSKDELAIWDESTYKCIKTIQKVECYSISGISKLKDDTVVVGGKNVISFVNIKNYKINQFKDQSLGNIWCLNVYKNGSVLIGNDKGEMFCYNSSTNKIIFKNKFHNKEITCIIETEDNKLISSSYDTTINIYN